MAAITAGLRLAEQVLFVFVASLWPNAVGGGDHVPLEMLGEGGNNPRPVRQEEQAQRDGMKMVMRMGMKMMHRI